MAQVPERSQRAGLGLPVLLSLGFVVLAPVGFFALPLAGIIWSAGAARTGRGITAALALGLGGWWLLQIGDPPDQLERSLALLATVSFVGLTGLSRLSVIHRSLVSMLFAAVAGAGLMTVMGRSWESLRWWVEYRTGYMAQVILTGMWSAVPRSADGIPSPGQDAVVVQVEDWLGSVMPIFVDLYPALLAIRLLGGLALAAFVAHRLGVFGGRAPRPGPFVQFRFTEHLGWAAVAALATVVLASDGTVRIAAMNVLLVAAVLYGIRGAAVAWFVVRLRGGPGFFTVAFLALALLFLLPAVAAWTIVVGVADTGLDLRKRWATPRARD